MTRGPYHFWTPADDAQVLLWCRGRISCIAAAKVIGVSDKAVIGRARRKGWRTGQERLPDRRSGGIQ